jgi:hypothetical protein
MKLPPRKAPGAGKQTGRKLIVSIKYHALRLLQAPFTYVFWAIEQRKALLQDRIENERSAQ